MDSTTQTTAVAEPIPADPENLCALLRATPWHERDSIRERLIAQLGNEDEAWQLYDNAESLVRHEEHLITARAQLRAALTSAAHQIRTATARLEELAGDEVYDVEYAEGGTAADMRAFLADAGRLVRAATALNPCPTEESA